jgi:hypothetical protein
MESGFSKVESGFSDAHLKLPVIIIEECPLNSHIVTFFFTSCSSILESPTAPLSPGRVLNLNIDSKPSQHPPPCHSAGL